MAETGEKVKPVSVGDFQAEVLASPTPVLVDFWAPWCGPCRMIRPVLEELSGSYAGRVKFTAVNVDDNQDLAVRYGVQSIPMVYVFKAGQVVDQIIGAQRKSAYETMLNSALKG